MATQAIILCGGMGTRLSEETSLKPKPLVTVGGKPILWHIMKIYAQAGINDFILALGYKGELIKEYFLNYYAMSSDLKIELGTGKVIYESTPKDDWRVQLIDTGQASMTGGRLLRLKPRLQEGGTFMMTYGDGVSDVDLKKALAFHKSHGKLVTVTAVRPTARFGGMAFDGNLVTSFKEKPQSGEGWVNGGFFIMEPQVFDYLENDLTIFEHGPLERLGKDGQLMAYRHEGYWQCMDTMRDRQLLEEEWASGEAPWKLWS